MTLWRSLAGIALLPVLIGCGGSDSTDDPITFDPSDSPSASQPSEPPVEPTDPESTQPTQQKPSIEIASAPIGGNVEPTQEGYQCAEVNWLGRNPIPAGTTIQLGSPHLEPGGVFELDQTGCGAKAPPCAPDISWQASSFKPCYVGVKQLADGDEVSLILSVSAECATEADCQSLQGDVPGSQISFSPGPPSG
ncbi:hypothetical protein [Streptomyces sp. SID13031]|uniref:hypothetical protein n=1 Tax=Streptomyces sp. SID13031 TaxID=2706046 RepID=UPI0013CC3AA7|nr:hypothetical protein [Streptomyces sp. SID13031]NEA35834.1 hypothetical protein [Streptomyces sp. SID13031]